MKTKKHLCIKLLSAFVILTFSSLGFSRGETIANNFIQLDLNQDLSTAKLSRFLANTWVYVEYKDQNGDFTRKNFMSLRDGFLVSSCVIKISYKAESNNGIRLVMDIISDRKYIDTLDLLTENPISMGYVYYYVSNESNQDTCLKLNESI